MFKVSMFQVRVAMRSDDKTGVPLLSTPQALLYISAINAPFNKLSQLMQPILRVDLHFTRIPFHLTNYYSTHDRFNPEIVSEYTFANEDLD